MTNTSSFRKLVQLFIGDFLKSLKDIAITQFSHSMTFGNNQLSALGSSKEVSAYFTKYKIPPYCCDRNGRILDEGIYTNKILAARYADFFRLNSILAHVGKKFSLNYGKKCS